MIPELSGVLSLGLEGLLHPTRARRELALQLRNAVMAELARPVDMEKRHRWAQVLQQNWWPVLESSREDGVNNGWPELFAAVALAQGLLLGARPAWVDARLQGRSEHGLWEAEWRLHRRCILLLSERVEVCPVFVGGDINSGSAPIEHAVVWRHDGPELRGRSHTLMLSLLRDKLLDGRCQAIAATGEILGDGSLVGPVRGLPEKAEAWWREEPDGLLITGPLGPMQSKDWGAFTGARWRTYDQRGEPLAWIVGGSRVELQAKLRHAETVVHAWDGRPIAGAGLVNVRLSWHGDQRPDNELGDPLQAAAWAAASSSGPNGILVLGAPGCGKSILSRQLEHRFQRGWLGSLGYGVRCVARELGVALLERPEASWAKLLAEKEPEQAELFEVLERTRRLVPIVDGLDELDRHQLALVCARLRAFRGWWVATGRPLHAVTQVVPPAWRLRIEELRSDEAKQLLEGAGRPGLANRLFPRPSGYQKRDDHVGELTKTPFHLSLLARSVDDDEELEGLSDSNLYSRAFKGLLDQARSDERLGDDDVLLLEGMLSSVIGELALNWLQSPTGFWRSDTVDLVLEDAGISVIERASVIRALEFGYLLAPANQDWEFSHRTIAEWAAARALTRQVQKRTRADQKDLGRAVDRDERGAIEAEVFAPFLVEEGLLPGTGPWAQILRFASDGVVEPLAFLRRLVGPESSGLWQVREQPGRRFGEPAPDAVRREARDHEVLESWSFAAELGRRMRWGSPEDARTWWAICVRRWLLMSDAPSRLHGQRGEVRITFHADVVWALPHRFLELVELAVLTQNHRARLRATPELLLSVIPPERAGAVRDLLKDGSRSGQLHALRWFEANAEEVAWSGLDGLIRSLPREIECAEATAKAEWERVRDLPRDHPDRGMPDHPNAVHLLKELETLAWELTLRDVGDLSWAAVRDRLFEGPSHILGVSARWMGFTTRSALGEQGALQRRDLLARVASLVGEQEKHLREVLEAYKRSDTGAKLVNSARTDFKNQEEPSHRTTLRKAVEELDWNTGFEQFYGDERGHVGEELDEVKEAVRTLAARQHRLVGLVRAVDGPSGHSVAGAVWAGLPLDSLARKALTPLVMGLRVVPRQVPVRAVFEHPGAHRYRENEGRVWQDHHLQELKQIAAGGSGEQRFRAIRALALHGDLDERIPLLEALSTADDELVDLVRSHMGQDLPLELVPSEAVPHLPLPTQARLDAPAWRLRLLAELANPADGFAMDALAKLASEYGVRAAVPALLQALRAKMSGGARYASFGADDLLVAACALMDEDDPRGTELVEYAFLHGWPGERRLSLGGKDDGGPSPEGNAGRFLASQLTMQHIGLLGDSQVTAANRDSLRDGIRALGSEGLSVLKCHLEEVTNKRHELRDEFASTKAARGESLELPSGSWQQDREFEERIEHLEKVRQALVQTIIAVVDERTTPLRELIELCFSLVGGDVHHVYSTPGPLGSDFDDAGDLDWHSEHKNAGEVAGMAEKLNGALARSPESWSELRRLFTHPSESLRKMSLQRVMAEAPPTQHVELAIEALAGHACNNQTSWTGQTSMFMLSGTPGMGTSYIQTPDTARTLVEAVRHALTPAHRSVVEWLACHELAPMRALACRWASELGDAEWVFLLRPLLADVEPEVFAGAQRALGALSPRTWEHEILATERSQWTAGHDQLLLREVFCRRGDEPLFESEHIWRPRLTAEALKVLVAEAIGRLPTRRGENNLGWDIVRGYPSLLDRALAAWSELEPDPEGLRVFLTAWLEHPRASVRASARKALALEMEVEDLRLQLGEGEPLDRVSAALCLVVRESSSDFQRVQAVMEAARSFSSLKGGSEVLGVCKPDPEAHRRRFEGMGEPEDLDRRLLDALVNAGLLWFPLFGLSLRDIYWDDEGNCWQGEAERVIRLSMHRARALGEAGLIALLSLHDELRDQQIYEHEKLIVAHLPLMPRLVLEVKRRLPDSGPTRYCRSVAERVWNEWSTSQGNPENPGVLELLRTEVYPRDWLSLPKKSENS